MSSNTNTYTNTNTQPTIVTTTSTNERKCCDLCDEIETTCMCCVCRRFIDIPVRISSNCEDYMCLECMTGFVESNITGRMVYNCDLVDSDKTLQFILSFKPGTRCPICRCDLTVDDLMQFPIKPMKTFSVIYHNILPKHIKKMTCPSEMCTFSNQSIHIMYDHYSKCPYRNIDCPFCEEYVSFAKHHNLLDAFNDHVTNACNKVPCSSCWRRGTYKQIQNCGYLHWKVGLLKSVLNNFKHDVEVMHEKSVDMKFINDIGRFNQSIAVMSHQISRLDYFIGERNVPAQQPPLMQQAQQPRENNHVQYDELAQVSTMPPFLDREIHYPSLTHAQSRILNRSTSDWARMHSWQSIGSNNGAAMNDTKNDTNTTTATAEDPVLLFPPPPPPSSLNTGWTHTIPYAYSVEYVDDPTTLEWNLED